MPGKRILECIFSMRMQVAFTNLFYWCSSTVVCDKQLQKDWMLSVGLRLEKRRGAERPR